MQVIWRALTKVAILLSLLLHQSLQACTTGQAPFPKIVGGTQSNTFFYQIDYNQVTDYLVAAGRSNDQGVRGDTLGSTFIPIIIAYQYNNYQWGKVFASLVSNEFTGVKISRQGTKLVVANFQITRYLIVMDITDGNVITATQFSASVKYDYYRRNLMLLDNGNILMGDDIQIVNVAPPSTSAPTYTLSSYSTIGLQTNTAQSYLHVFSYASSICIITVMDMATFTRVYQYQAQCASTSADNLAQTFQSCLFETSSTVDTIVFQEGTRFFRVNNQYSQSTFTTSTVHDPTSLYARGLHCGSNELVYSLMQGTYSGGSNRIFVATVYFNTNKIIYQRYLQSTSGATVYHGVIISYSQFYLGGWTQIIIKSASTSFNTRSSLKNGIIYSSMLTCQQADQQYTYPVVTLAVNGFTLTATANPYTSSSITVTDLSSSLPAMTNIVSTQFEDQYAADCNYLLPHAPHVFTALSSTQTTSSYTFEIESASHIIPITPFTATPIPVYAYSLYSYSGTSGTVSVAADTGYIIISSAIAPATYIIAVEGKLDDCQTIKFTFTITVVNTPPSFKGVSGKELPDTAVV
ncbi:hypothetical protein FGO68_gene15455 [Halteria grandinella]|uniref:Uncharacterized protein n=1 Tax=Halteria grandinella TaxID=5974 RepID=A0A8J8P3I9_HALGN|nr:hypothetical protein FGO68_gene15455 [Halteria grandinella]